MNSILVIGTEPQCPRCKVLTNILEAKVKEMQLDAEVRHIAYTDKEAEDIARANNLESGTAKKVALKLKLKIDGRKIDEIIEAGNTDPDCEYSRYNDCNWSRELDKYLRVFENRAKEAGIMMTPVLVINGVLKHQGSVPELKQIDKWLQEIKE